MCLWRFALLKWVFLVSFRPSNSGMLRCCAYISYGICQRQSCRTSLLTHTHLPLAPLLLFLSPISIFSPLIRWFGPITVKEWWERARPFVNQTHRRTLSVDLWHTHINFFKKHHIKSHRFTENLNLRAIAEAKK